MRHTPKDYLQVYNMTAQRSTSPSVKSDNKENVWRGYFHRAAVRKTRVVYLFVGPLLFFSFFFAHSSISPVEQIGLYWAEAVELVLDRCVAYTPQGQMVLKKGCASETGREGERERWVREQMVELLNVQTSLGSIVECTLLTLRL